jgi:alpha/beta superfamily hydrolase
MDGQQRRRWSRSGIRRRLPPLTCLSLIAAVTVAGCGTATRRQAPPASVATPAQTATPAGTRTPAGAADWPCLSARERRDMFVLDGPGHDHLAVLSIGTGRVGVILAHQVSGSLCQWWPYARSLAASFRVVAFDFDGCGASPPGDGNYPGEVAAAAQWARQHRSRQIVLMGASMGGTAVMAAAAYLGDSVTGVIDLSGPALFGRMNALTAARRVHVPALFGYGTLDLAFAGDIRDVRAATATRDKPVVTVSNPAHGVDLVAGYANVRRAVLRFIQKITHR